ncbi:unnamed protein product, partial [Staurois parvus]
MLLSSSALISLPSSNLISIPGSNLISIPGGNLISIPGGNLISFLAAISSASLSCSSDLCAAERSGVPDRISSDSQLTWPLIHHAPKHGFSLSFLFSPTL